MADRYLFLARHGEAVSEEDGLTEGGRRQAVLLGQRLRRVPLTTIHHGPSIRTTETARLVAEQLDGVPCAATDLAGDYVPHVPGREELPPESADALLGFLSRFTAEERAGGAALAEGALRRFTGPAAGSEPVHELVVTHSWLVGWLARAALGAAPWRWLTLNHCNAGLTVIRYAPRRAPGLLAYNDVGHLPERLRWTGFPPAFGVS